MTPSGPLLVAAPGLVLPEDAATSTWAFLGQTGSGKSNAGVVMAERYFDAGQPWVSIDPKGDWWGITLEREGTGPGLPIPVIGGRHGNVPLDPSAGRPLARLVAEQRTTLILDTSELDEPAAVDLLIDFFDELYRTNEYPLHVFMEEASEYLPQTLPAEIKRMAVLVRKVVRMVKMGRSRGIGFTLLDQRASAVTKSALSQVKNLVALLNTAPLDAKAVLDYLKGRPEHAEVSRTLAELAPGDAWVYSPSYLAQRGQPALRRVHFERRRTFDSGATPTTAGPPPDTNRATLDLDTLTSTLAQAVERAAEEDPDALRRQRDTARARVRELEREVTTLRERPAATEGYPKDKVRDYLTRLAVGQDDLNVAVLDELERATKTIRGLIEPGPGALRGILKLLDGTHSDQVRPSTTIPRSMVEGPIPPDPRAVAFEAVERAAKAAPAAVEGSGEKLPKAERAVLTVLAQHGSRTRPQIGVLAGYSAKGGGFGNALSALRTKGYITRRDPMDITDAGRSALGEYETLPTGRALVEHWQAAGRLGKAEREILDVLTASSRPALTREQIAARTASQYEAKGGGFGNALSKLRSLELIHGRREMTAAPELFEES